MVARLQVKASQIGKLLQTLESKGAEDNAKKMSSSQLSKQKSESSGPPVKKPHYIDPIPPFNANKIRKSPSASLTSDSNASSASGTSSKSQSQSPIVHTETASTPPKGASTSETGK